MHNIQIKMSWEESVGKGNSSVAKSNECGCLHHSIEMECEYLFALSKWQLKQNQIIHSLSTSVIIKIICTGENAYCYMRWMKTVWLVFFRKSHCNQDGQRAKCVSQIKYIEISSYSFYKDIVKEPGNFWGKEEDTTQVMVKTELSHSNVVTFSDWWIYTEKN